MKCNDARKYLYAFADGQLGVEANCDVLDHLKMCPECSRLVDEHQALRGAIGRAIAAVPVPRGLREKVRARLSTTAAGSFASLGNGRFAWMGAVLRARTFAAAAAVAFVVLGAWWVWPRQTAKGPTPVPVAVEDGRMAAERISEIHLAHAAMGKAHHNRQWPATLGESTAALARHFGNQLEVAPPNLSSYGYEFESANLCGIHADGNSPGGHIVYVSRTGDVRLSFFVSPRLVLLDSTNEADEQPDSPYREFELPQADGGNLSLLSWHKGQTTFVCCGAVEVNRMKLMVGAIRTAMPDFDRQLQLACARLHASSAEPADCQ